MSRATDQQEKPNETKLMNYFFRIKTSQFYGYILLLSILGPILNN